jgi:CheY-like chemotaxis protein
MIDSLIQNVLVVDDETEIRTMIQRFLQKSGYFCMHAANAFDALEMIRQVSFDLVVSDIRMAGKDGLQLMQEARKAHPDLDFIIITGHAADFSYSDIIDAGASDFLLKPFGAGELIAKIKRIGREKQILHYLRETVKALTWEAAANASIAELAKALISSIPMSDISSLVLKHAKELTESRLGYVGYVDRDSGSLVCPKSSLASDRDENGDHGSNASAGGRGRLPWGPVLETRAPVLYNAPEDHMQIVSLPRDEDGRPRFHRFLSAPAMISDTLLGHVVVANSKRDYTPKDIGLIERLADIYALAIRRNWTEKDECL